MISTTYPDGAVARMEYDAAGQLSASIDALGGRSEFGYDLAGRIEKWGQTNNAYIVSSARVKIG